MNTAHASGGRGRPVTRLNRHLCILVLLTTTLLAAGQHSPPPTTVELLDRYATGAFEGVVTYLSGDVAFDDLLKQLRRDGPAWIDARGPEARERRRLTAATFALEAARADAWHEWKWIMMQPTMQAPGVVGSYQPLNVLYWKPPPLLIEWACELWREDPTPRPTERWWQLAALAVAQRSEDPGFLVGDTSIGRGVGAGEIVNTQDEIKHLEHATPRFPSEIRLQLAQGIARDRDWHDDAEQVYNALLSDADVGGEAAMRLGAMRMRQGRLHEALESFERAERLTRDPYVVYLARYFAGQVHERGKDLDRAEAAYRGAVAAVPHAQSATVPLASLLFRGGRRTQAQTLIRRMLDADPPVDPWRAFVHADDRFWPQLIGRLRAEILK
jgi:tetratricopeptide (TPR) repeat protein